MNAQTQIANVKLQSPIPLPVIILHKLDPFFPHCNQLWRRTSIDFSRNKLEHVRFKYLNPQLCYPGMSICLNTLFQVIILTKFNDMLQQNCITCSLCVLSYHTPYALASLLWVCDCMWALSLNTFQICYIFNSSRKKKILEQQPTKHTHFFDCENRFSRICISNNAERKSKSSGVGYELPDITASSTTGSSSQKRTQISDLYWG